VDVSVDDAVEVGVGVDVAVLIEVGMGVAIRVGVGDAVRVGVDIGMTVLDVSVGISALDPSPITKGRYARGSSSCAACPLTYLPQTRTRLSGQERAPSHF
jgi:hypothetical protein